MTQRYFFFVSFALFIYLSYFLQTTLLLSPDVGYLIYASKQWLHGGHYGKEIFETNPPLILYLYAPIHFLNNILGDYTCALRFYVLAWAAISSGISYVLLKKLIPDKFYRFIIFTTLLFVLFILPIYAFGQREHLLMIFIFPYVLNVALGIERKPISFTGQFFIGSLAGLGFALKPFFLVPLVLIELLAWQPRIKAYFCKHENHSMHSLIRIDSFAIFLVLIFYFISIFIWQPEYLAIILPLVLKYYFIGHFVDGTQLFLTGSAIFCVFCFAMLVAYMVFYPHDRHQTLGRIFFLGLVGMLLAYIIPKQPWYYHLYPAIGFAFLLLAHFLGQVFKTKNLLLITLGFGIFGSFPLSQCYFLLLSMQDYKMQRPQNEIAKYIQAQTGPHSLYCFAPFTSDCFPLVYQVQSNFASGYPSFWWFTGLRKVEKENKITPQFLQDKAFFIDQISHDLECYKARWIVVNEGNFQFWEGTDFSIMNYFSENEKFADTIRHYHLVKKIKYYSIYERKDV